MNTSQSTSPNLIPVSFTVNGKKTDICVEPRSLLIDTLRDDLQLTGTKKGCGEGVCGSCSVLLNGNVICSCLMLTVEAEDTAILTIEGLQTTPTKETDRLQEAFVEADAMQCGFCTPGQVLSAKAFISRLNKGERASELEIKEALEGNLCRCGSYNNIIKAVMQIIGFELG